MSPKLGDLTAEQLLNLAADWTEKINDATNNQAQEAAQYELKVILEVYQFKKLEENSSSNDSNKTTK